MRPILYLGSSRMLLLNIGCRLSDIKSSVRLPLKTGLKVRAEVHVLKNKCRAYKERRFSRNPNLKPKSIIKVFPILAMSSFFENISLPSPASFQMSDSSPKSNIALGVGFLLEKMESRSFQVGTSLLSVIMLYFAMGLLTPHKMKATPFVGGEKDASFHDALKQGYAQVGSIFVILLNIC